MSCDVFDVTCPRYRTAAGTYNPQLAIDDARARGGGTVLFPGGDIAIENGLDVPFDPDPQPYDFAPTIHLVGAGPDLTILKRANPASTFNLLTIRRGFTTVSGITFDGAGTGGAGHGVVVGEDHSAATQGRIYRRVQLRNCTIRNCPQFGLYIRGGFIDGLPENQQPPISIQGSYSDVVLGGNGSSAIVIEKRNTTHFFRGLWVNSFKGHAIHLDGCSGIAFAASRFDGNLVGSTECAYLKNAVSCHFDGCWFEEANGTDPLFWFVYMDTGCTGTSIHGCSFVRKRTDAKAVAIGATGACNGVMVLAPRVKLLGGMTAGDSPIWILNASEATVLGGIVEIEIPQPGLPPLFEYKAVEINDLSNRTSMLAPTRRLRLPRATASDVGQFVTNNLKVSDVINRLIVDGRVGTGLEAYNGTNWIPLTVNRYANVAALAPVTSRDRGTLAWADAEGRLMVFDGTSWQQVYP